MLKLWRVEHNVELTYYFMALAETREEAEDFAEDAVSDSLHDAGLDSTTTSATEVDLTESSPKLSPGWDMTCMVYHANPEDISLARAIAMLTDPDLRPTTEELERAGQMRLAIDNRRTESPS